MKNDKGRAIRKSEGRENLDYRGICLKRARALDSHYETESDCLEEQKHLWESF